MENSQDRTEYLELTEEFTPGAERRLVHRLLDHWRSLRNEDALPSFDDIDFSENNDIGPHSFFVQLDDGAPAPVFAEMGTELASHLDMPLVGCPVSDAPRDCLPGAATAYIDEILRRGAPVSRGGELVTHDGKKMLYRSILLPMSDDGETITGILGAANCRFIRHDEAVAH